jgi:hypothetical protein
MFVNPDHNELIQKEIRKTRQEEAAHWRLVREVKPQQPSPILRFLRHVWTAFRLPGWKKKQKYISLQNEIRESPSY